MKVIISQPSSFLTNDKNFIAFIQNILLQISGRYQQHQFIFFSDSEKTIPSPGNNIHQVKFSPPALGRIVQKKWYSVKLKSTIGKLKPDVLVSLDETPEETGLPECVVITHTKPKNIRRLCKSACIITPSLFIKNALIQQGVPSSLVHILGPGISGVYQPADWSLRDEIKNKYTDGREYFLLMASAIADEHLLNVLKAFSIFKKWQQSNMQLLVLGKFSAKTSVQTLLKTYKYREDVKILEEDFPDSDNVLIKAAMAVIYLPFADVFGQKLAEILQCSVPVITWESGALTEIGGDAVLYIKPELIQGLADQLMKIYKDDKLRSLLTYKSVERSLQFSEEKAIDTLWQLIEHLVAV